MKSKFGYDTLHSSSTFHRQTPNMSPINLYRNDDRLSIFETTSTNGGAIGSVNNVFSISDTDQLTVEATNNGKWTKSLIFCLIICSIGSSFQVGWSIGVLNTPVQAFRQFYNETHQYRYSEPMSETQWTGLWSITNGLMPLGAMFGGFGSGYVADYFGRLVILSGILSVLAAYVKSYTPFILGRFITGIECGLFTGIGPIYLSEVAPRNLRGAAGTMHQLAIVLGILLTNVAGLPSVLGSVDHWPYLYAITLIPSIIHFVFLPFCVETPKYVFINRNDQFQAEAILKTLRGRSNPDYILSELEELAAEKSVRLKQNLVSFKDLFTKPALSRPLLLTIVIQISQQCSGISSIAFYSTNMFISIGLDPNTWAVYATIVIDVFKVLITVVCLLLIEITGRRKLLILGLFGMSLSAFALAILPDISSTSVAIKYLTVTSAVFYVIFFSIGPGSIPWLITAELFASDARGKATSIAVLANWLSNFIISVSIPLVMASINNHIYLIFGVMIMFFIAFIYLKVPETKNRSIEEISKHFK